MKPRGNTRKIVLLTGEIQELIGRAIGAAMNDRDPDQMEHTLDPLQEAFDLCLHITNMYEPLDNVAPRRGGDTE